MKNIFKIEQITTLKESELRSYLTENAGRQVDELIDWLRIPSISTRAENREDMKKAAQWLSRHLLEIGMENVEVIETGGHPLVYADWLHAGEDRPTVLLYGHYDVQPVEPLDKWETPPFEPSLRGDDLYGRGTTDDKGQLFALAKALQALLTVRGKLPVNIKLIAEGDEESGADSLPSYLSKNPQKFAADICLVADTAVISPTQPCITYGLRGMWSGELVVRGPRHDLHSGSFGGTLHNPAQALAEILATFHDADGRIAVPGFYDNVTDLEPAEREKLAKVPYGEAEILAETGAPALYGEPGYTPVERTGTRPTLEINGMWGGFIDEGFMPVIPAEAWARLSCRLVPHQDPERIARLLKEHLERVTPSTVSAELISQFGMGAALTDPEGPAVRAAEKAYTLAFGKDPVFKREGGGIPIVSVFQEVLGAQVVLLGFGLPDDNAHAPNEKIHLPNFYRGIITTVHFMDQLASSR